MEMTDAARGRRIIERWCVLAEQRLDYLTDLFETGRWQRFFGELAFLENIREAKLAVETWNELLHREATPDNRPVDLSWLGRRSALPPRQIEFHAIKVGNPAAVDDEARDRAPAPIIANLPESADEPLLISAPSIAMQPEVVPLPEQVEAWQQALDPELLQQRYPLLRNAF